jgi:hypothetical protein
MSADDFWHMTPRELHLAVQGYYEALDEQRQHDFTVARFNASLNITPWLKKGSNVKPQDLCRFEWEKDQPGSVHRMKPGIRNPAILNMMNKRWM